MARKIPEAFLQFLKTATEDMDDGYEYASELNRIINSDDGQRTFTAREIERLRDYADHAKKIGEFNRYAVDRLKEEERELFGRDGILGFLGEPVAKKEPQWPF